MLFAHKQHICAAVLLACAVLAGCTAPAAPAETSAALPKPPAVPIQTQLQNLPTVPASTQPPAPEQTLYVSPFQGIWKYDSREEYLAVWDNMTYTTAGEDLEPDNLIRFWDVDPDDNNTMVLYNYSGTHLMTVTADEAQKSLTDANGDTLSPAATALNGTYYCCIGDENLDGTSDLWLTCFTEIWMNDDQVQELMVRKTLRLPQILIEDTPISKIERDSADHIRINSTMHLDRNAQKNAWQLTGHDILWTQWLGNCVIDSNTEFIDTLDEGKHTRLRECFAAHGTVYAYVTVQNGIAQTIEITELF